MSPRESALLARERLLDEGVRAFVLHGYHGTGIKQILDAVGVPKGSFYNYFDSKEAFGAAVIEHYADSMAALLADALAGAPSASAGLRAFLEADMRRLEDAGYVGGCLVANLGAEIEMSEKCSMALRVALQRYVDGITGAVARAQHEGDIRTDIPAAALAGLLVDAWEGAVIRMKIQRSAAPLQACLERLLDGFFRP